MRIACLEVTVGWERKHKKKKTFVELCVHFHRSLSISRSPSLFLFSFLCSQREEVALAFKYLSTSDRIGNKRWTWLVHEIESLFISLRRRKRVCASFIWVFFNDAFTIYRRAKISCTPVYSECVSSNFDFWHAIQTRVRFILSSNDVVGGVVVVVATVIVHNVSDLA